jgi:hypothetical protein
VPPQLDHFEQMRHSRVLLHRPESMNLAGSFWVNAFGTHLGNQASPIDAILERSDFTLQELLAQDDIIQECKALNGALIE